MNLLCNNEEGVTAFWHMDGGTGLSSLIITWQIGRPKLAKFGSQSLVYAKVKNLSLRDVAARCNVDHANVSKIEQGKLNISLTTLVELAAGLGVPPKKFLDFEIPE